MHCKKCNHNLSGFAGRIRDHLISKAGTVRIYTIVALYALRVEYGHCRIRVDTASRKSGL